MSTRIVTARERLALIGALGVAERVARGRGVMLDDMLSGERRPAAVGARHELWSLIRGSTALSLPEIARVFGVDPSTVLDGIVKRETALAREYGA